MGKKDCWMCDPDKYEFLDASVRVNRLVEDKKKYYVVVPQDPRVWCHILIVLKKHREGLVKAQKDELKALMEPVLKWVKVLSKALECDRVYLACLCDSEPGERHLHYHLIPVQKENKVYYGHGFQWLGFLEYQSEMEPFDKCSESEKKCRGKYIESMVGFLKQKIS